MSTEKLPKLAQNVVINWGTMRVTVDGEPFPFYMAQEGPTVDPEPRVDRPPALYIVHIPLLANGLTEVGERPDGYLPDGHRLVVCKGCEHGCMFCEGGLSACRDCGALEGAWPDNCPGKQMTEEQSLKVYAGELNYRNGQWLEECCRAMLHVHYQPRGTKS